MIFYDYPLAFNPAKAKLILEEKGTPYKAEFVNLFKGRAITPEFLKLNPAGSVPVLVDGEKVITESKEIITYIDNLDGKPLGGTSVDRPFVDEWLQQVDAFDGNLFFAAHGPSGAAKIVGPLFLHNRRIAEANKKRHPEMADVYEKKIQSMIKNSEAPKDPAVAAKNLKDLEALLDLAEERLAVHPYLGGDEYSAADVIFTPVLYRIGAAGKMSQLIKPRPNVSTYWDTLKKRKSYKTVFGPQNNGLYAASLILPAVFNAKVASLFHWY